MWAPITIAANPCVHAFPSQLLWKLSIRTYR